MSDWLAVAGQVAARSLNAGDEGEYLARVRASALLHRGWVALPNTSAAFAQFLTRCARDDVHAFLLIRREDGALVGAANLTQIDDGPLSNAWIAFNAFVPYDCRGYMTDGLRAVLRHAFGSLRLQRVEADVQPANTRSLALLTRVGFRREACPPRHAKIGGRWRDYERWAIHAEPPASAAQRAPADEAPDHARPTGNEAASPWALPLRAPAWPNRALPDCATERRWSPGTLAFRGKSARVPWQAMSFAGRCGLPS